MKGFLVEVSYRKRLKKITLLRFLCSKIVYEPNRVKPIDLIVLYDVILWAQMKSSTDRNFRRNFGESLELLANILKRFPAKGRVYAKSLTEKLHISFKKDWSFLIPERNYNQVKERMSGNYHLNPARPNGIPVKNLPPKTFVGKGYGDKGTLKNPAVDGSPTWKEIASSTKFQIEILLKELKEHGTEIEIRERIEKMRELKDLIDLYQGKGDFSDRD